LEPARAAASELAASPQNIESQRARPANAVASPFHLPRCCCRPPARPRVGGQPGVRAGCGASKPAACPRRARAPMALFCSLLAAVERLRLLLPDVCGRILLMDDGLFCWRTRQPCGLPLGMPPSGTEAARPVAAAGWVLTYLYSFLRTGQVFFWAGSFRAGRHRSAGAGASRRQGSTVTRPPLCGPPLGVVAPSPTPGDPGYVSGRR